MSPISPRLALVLCAGVAVVATHPAHGDPQAASEQPARPDPRAEPTNPQARAHFDRGGKLFALRDWEGAIAEYKQGALIESLPVFDLALGQCYRRLRRYDDALWHFNRFVRYGQPSGKLLQGVEDLLRQIRAELAQEPPRATQSGPVERTPGAAPSFWAQASAPPPVATPPAAAVTVDRREPWYRDALGLGLVTVGTVAAGTAGYLLFDAHRARDESNTDPVQVRRDELYDQSVSRYRWGAALGVASGSLLIVGVIRLATRPVDHVPSGATSWHVGVSSDGVVVFGRF
jgi:tetratricopeptide (TPR) repeat protein